MRRSLEHACLTAAFAATALWAVATPTLGQASEYKLDGAREWAPQASPQPGTDAWTIAEARRMLAENRPEEARRSMSDWIEKNERSKNPLLPEAYLVRGDALLALDDEFEALYDYEAIAKGYRASEQFPIAVRRELDIAERYANGLKLRSLGFRWADSSEIAEELMIRVQERMPRSALAEEAAIQLADFYYRRRDMKLARDAYDLYLENFPDGPHRIRALARRIQTEVARFKGPRYSGAGLINARLQIRDFMSRYPAEADRLGMNEALIARIDESMAAQLFDTSQWYLKIDDEPSARFTLSRLLRDYPRTVAAERGIELLQARGWLTQNELQGLGETDQNAPSPEPLGIDTRLETAPEPVPPDEGIPEDAEAPK